VVRLSTRVVCISRQEGARGQEIGRLVADRLGLEYVDEAVIERAAERGGVEPDVVADTEERKSLLRRVVELLADAGTASGTVGAEPTAVRVAREESHRELIRGVIEEVAEQGNAVIVAHAASMALVGRDGVLRVLVTASDGVRTRRIAERDGVDESQAAKLIRHGDASRAAYVKHFYKIDRELPTHYDVVVNTDCLDPERAADVIVQAAGGPG
jgi:hypothetical protein